MTYSTYNRTTNIIFPKPFRTEPNNYFGINYRARPPPNSIPPRNKLTKAPDAEKDGILLLKPPPIEKQFH
jgi:hypothetical protein